MAKDGSSPKTSTVSEDTRRLQARILDMYRDTPNFAYIARQLDYSETYIKKMYKKALKLIIVDSVENLRKVEVARLDRLHAKTMELLDEKILLVNSGKVVRDVVEGPDGKVMLDEDGNPILKRLHDKLAALNVVDRVLKIQERRAKLLGLDMPTKTALTDPTGEKEAAPLVQFYLPSNGRDETPPEEPS